MRHTILQCVQQGGKPGLGLLTSVASEGKDGEMGATGKVGDDGQRGQNGSSGQHGSVTYHVVNKHGEVIESASSMYDIKIISFDVCMVEPYTGIVQPGQCLIIKNIKLSNDGGLVLPKGARLTCKSTGFIQSDDVIVLPQIPPYRTHLLTNTLEIHIRDQVQHDWIAEQQDVSIQLQVDMLGRVFPRSRVSASIRVEFPVHMSIKHPSHVICGSKSQLGVSISNKMLRGETTLRKVRLQVQCSAPVKFLNTKTLSGTLVREFDGIGPQESIDATIDFQMGYDAHFYEDYHWIVSLMYGSTLIQEDSYSMQAIPGINLNESSESDVLMIIVNRFSREKYQAYNTLFQLLSLRVQWFDCCREMQQSENDDDDDENQLPIYDPSDSTQPLSDLIQRFHGKLIILCASSIEQLMQQLDASLIISHFRNEGIESSSHSSGFVAVIDETTDGELTAINEQKRQDKVQLLRYLTLSDRSTVHREKSLDPITEFSASFRYLHPSEEFAEQRCREIEESYEQASPTNRFYVKIDRLHVKELEDRKLASWVKMNWKYSFGDASLYRSAVTMLDHFIAVRINQTEFESELNTNELLDLLIEPMEGRFRGPCSSCYRLLHTIVAGLSLYRRLQLIQETSDRLARSDSVTRSHHDTSLMDGNHQSQSQSQRNTRATTHQFLSLLRYLARETIYQDLRREILFPDHYFHRLEQLCSITHNVEHRNLTSDREVISAIVYILSKLERSSYWRSWIPGMLASIVESLKEKREMLTLLKDSCLSILHARVTSHTMPEDSWNDIVAKATMDAEQRSNDSTVDMDDTSHAIPKAHPVYYFLIE